MSLKKERERKGRWRENERERERRERGKEKSFLKKLYYLLFTFRTELYLVSTLSA